MKALAATLRGEGRPLHARSRTSGPEPNAQTRAKRRVLKRLLALPLALTAFLASAPAFAQSLAITGSNPASLNQGNLRDARIDVTLTGATYDVSVAASFFTLTTAVPGLTIHSASFNSARTVATLRLHYDGSDFDTARTIAFTIAGLTTGTQAVAPARWVNVSKKTIALTEGGSAATYAVTLESPPTANVTVTVASDNPAVTRSPATLTFTTQNWNTAQTVTVAPVDDNTDTVDEVALVTNVATGGGYVDSTVASRTVRVTVDDDEPLPSKSQRTAFSWGWPLISTSPSSSVS